MCVHFTIQLRWQLLNLFKLSPPINRVIYNVLRNMSKELLCTAGETTTCITYSTSTLPGLITVSINHAIYTSSQNKISRAKTPTFALFSPEP